MSLQLGLSMQQYEAQRGLWSCYLNRAMIADASQQAIQNLALAQKLQHPRCLRDAHTNMGIACFQVGEFAAAAGHFQCAVAEHVPPESSPVGAWGFELGIEAPFLSASTVYLLGYPEQARQRMEEALMHAYALPDPYTRVCGPVFCLPLLSACARHPLSAQGRIGVGRVGDALRRIFIFVRWVDLPRMVGGAGDRRAHCRRASPAESGELPTE